MHLIPVLISIILPVVFMTLAWWLSSRPLPTLNKYSPFECGFDPKNTARIPFSLRFFLLAVIFLVFDVEIVLIIPIPVTLLLTPSSTLFLSISIAMILAVGLFHEWNEGSLNWE
uniref:NADH-ubiquinone oxidoreductase chain 3 n=1 Tax=Osedax rubiplumus TaxID=283784 RepID=A0A6M4ALA2_OSERU|nr:NADH dehydrogenase subunit 3 [Osedax rubiplumus]QJQ26883.1 NADH dehydrogenase subunit 3 [Osedax rubiplumus]